ncbi:outer membrane protein assembly factor BamB family protein [Urbifossiella limnaea]|uniref:Outer membrane biogenesis protein BamB n=1 Tax=Urbifossiella limnaea TaxID=2528023 RepID=A0A517XRK7_9BACT|nr:PQQ-binding-like beta-propeller repeat protein [Urbifossiella limnaea]QDU20092.1 outer membrane biogenesis protein BamB [Urbifossiella limnaea]
MPRVVAVVLLTASVAAAADWPAWRGPTGQGLADEPAVPLKWGPKESIKWKVPLAHPGNSTPVVWKDSIYLTLATKGGATRSLLCLSRADGSTRWQKDVQYEEQERNWNETWYANASPVVDAERVVVSFGSAGMFCFNHAGAEQWRRTDLGRWEHAFGNSSSPVLHGGRVILWCGPNEKEGRNYLLAVDARTGKTAWEHDEPTGSWATPVLAKVNGQDQLILGLSKDVKTQPEEKHGHLKGYDPATGSELWSARGLNSYVYTSALVADGVVVGMSGYGGSAMAVKLGGRGDVTADRLWIHPKNTQRVGSGVVVGGHIYQVDEDGRPHRYDLRTGADAWAEEAKLKGGVTWGSMVHAGGRLYVMMRDGSTHVLAPAAKFELLATNLLGPGEQTNASPVVAGGELFLRTFRHLWCVAVKK